MNIWHKLFGKWEKESQQIVTATYSSILCKGYAMEVLVVVEKNSKSGKKRVYTVDILGNKTSINLGYLKEMMK